VVSSTGTLAVFKLDPVQDPSSPLKELAVNESEDGDGCLFLSCQWHPRKASMIAITTSTGEVRLIQLNSEYRVIENCQRAVLTHTLEAWCVAFSSPGNENGNEVSTIYSGGDDSALRCISYAAAASPGESFDLSLPYPSLNLSGHGAGVTAILPLPISLPDGWEVVVTGSYDDSVRIFAIQPPSVSYGTQKSKIVAHMNLGGGVWRLKLVDTNTDGTFKARILASCMHAGARVLQISGGIQDEQWSIEVVGRFEEHESMNYGSDFLPYSHDGRLVCLSTSFYDRLLCLWELKLLT
jgi:diphthine methyl ester acylhydrolase